MNTPTFNLLAEYKHILSQNLGRLALAASGTRLTFTMERQTQTNWCWAATSDSVSHYYTPSSTWSQCTIANACLGSATCCATPGPCNVYGYLDRALTVTKNFKSMVAGTITFGQIKAEILSGRPIGVRTAWSGGGAHFLCIIGYDTIGNVPYVYLDDPIYGPSFITLSQFTNNYRGSGRWTHTYYTKQVTAMLKIKLPTLRASVLEEIKRIRPVIFPELEKTSFERENKTATEAALPHNVYTIGLSTIKDGTLSKENGRLRVLETANNALKAVYDIASTKDTDEVVGVVSEGFALGELQEALDTASNYIAQRNEELELSFINIPSLYVEAIWLNYEGKDDDLFIPTRTIGAIEAQKVYTNSEFWALLKEAASQIPDMKDDDTLGG